ncbi:hypothetical protein BC830DRAFT_1121855 [Chytriomyces sp. MP71]|nr:hypothetical protein BC830DRAFT_1121855 [Chytriomyces sp. MP71]
MLVQPPPRPPPLAMIAFQPGLNASMPFVELIVFHLQSLFSLDPSAAQTGTPVTLPGAPATTSFTVSVSKANTVFFKNNIARVLAQSRAPAPIIVMALLYLSRLRNVVAEDSFGSTLAAQFQLFCVALIISSKLHDDARHGIDAWCNITGMNRDLCAKLEMQFLERIDWCVHVHPESYKQMTKDAGTLLEAGL